MSNSTQIANTLEIQGKELAAEYKTRTAKADRIMFNFKKDTAADGFDTRLGKLMQSLRLEGGMRISSDRLRDCGIASIPKQRRSDAEWYVNTKAEADAFNKKAKKGFKNLSALRKAMAQAAKAEEPKPWVDFNGVERFDNPSADVKSDVGPTDNVVEVVDSASLALQLIADCEKHGIAIHEVLDILSPYNVQQAVA
jgi:hypothetical protein